MNAPVRSGSASRAGFARGVVGAWALCLVWIGVIALESFAGSTQNTGRWIYPLLRFLFPGMRFVRMIEIHAILRKVGHFSGYCILSVTLYRAWWTTLAARAGSERLWWRDMFRAWRGYAVLLALLGTLVVAGADEFHQSFTPGRTGSIADVALDEMGAAIAQIVILIVSSVAPARRNRQADPEPIISS